MAITVREYRVSAEHGAQVTREETVRSNRAAEARVRRWCREAGHDVKRLEEADTEFGYQWSLDWEACGEPGTTLWESEASSLFVRQPTRLTNEELAIVRAALGYAEMAALDSVLDEAADASANPHVGEAWDTLVEKLNEAWSKG